MFVSSVHEDRAHALLEMLHTDPAAAAVLLDTTNAIRSGDYCEADLADIGQTQSPVQDWPAAQIAAWLDVHTKINTGEYAKVVLPVGASPGPDRDRHGNAEKLRNLPPVFTAELDMYQQGAEQDGGP